jgi:antiphage defense system Thoeris ThsB-like protein
VAKKVYFAFHYQDVIDFRANVVRKHNFTKGVETAGYYDYSIWEETKKAGDVALKRMINAELANTSVTAVLIGSNTYARRWVRYEIMKSVKRGNKLLGIHINSIPGKDKNTKPLGPNPFDNLGLQIGDDLTTGKPTEWNGERWVFYSDLDPFPIVEQSTANKGLNFRLSKWFCTYDWVAEAGFNNFSTWIE